ncbi:MAG: YbhB/YbcL family Raf kinase inhibitor-like protein [Candidatus Sulfobium sp.]
MKSVYLLSIVLLISGAFTSISMGKEERNMGNFMIASPAFEENGRIPQEYTCDGEDVNPPLNIENVPPSAKSLALIVDDPDAPGKTWVHWVLWNIPPATTEIKENSVPKGAAQGKNDFGKNSYGGPCPPSGTHRYFFKLYALDTPLQLGSRSTKYDLESAMRGHIVSQTELIGLYRRK